MTAEQRLPDHSPYRYRVTKFLHRDRRGVLLAGVDRVTGEEVGLRQIDLRQFEARYRERYLGGLRRDIAAAATFAHPAIVVPRSLHVEGDDAFIVMDPLADAHPLAEQEPLSPSAASALVCQALDALEKAHARRVSLHELRMRNFFATPGGLLRIIEFGLVPGDVGDVLDAQEARTEEAGMLSPEHAVGEPVGPRSDVFSIGCLLYRLVTGRLPFTGADYTTTVARIVSTPHPDMGIDRLRTMPSLSAVIDRALAKKPEDRFESALSFQHALEAAARPQGASPPAPAATAHDIEAIAAALVDVAGPLAPLLMRRLTRDAPTRDMLLERCATLCGEDAPVFHAALDRSMRPGSGSA